MGCNFRDEMTDLLNDIKSIDPKNNLTVEQIRKIAEEISGKEDIKEESLYPVFYEYTQINPDSFLAEQALDQTKIPLSKDLKSKAEKENVAKIFGVKNIRELNSLRKAVQKLNDYGNWKELTGPQKKAYAKYMEQSSANPELTANYRINNSTSKPNNETFEADDFSTPFDDNVGSPYEEFFNEKKDNNEPFKEYEYSEADINEVLMELEPYETLFDTGDIEITDESVVLTDGSTFVKKGSSADSRLYEPSLGDEAPVAYTISMSKQLGAILNSLATNELDAEGGHQKLNPIVTDTAFINHLSQTVNIVQEFFSKYNDSMDLELTLFNTGGDVHAVAHNMYRPSAGIAKMNFDDKTSKMLKAQIDIRINSNQMQSSATETYVHELMHVYFGKAIERSPEAQKELKRVRDILLKRGASYEIFLEGSRKKAEIFGQTYTPSKAEIQVAKEKFDYVFGKGVDIEEFAAYLISNPYVYNFAKSVEESNINSIDITKDKVEDGLAKGGIINAIMDIIRSLLFSSNLSSDNVTNSDSIDSLISNLMEHTAAANFNINSPSTKERIIKGIDTAIKKTKGGVHYEYIIGKIEELGVRIDPYTKKSIKELGKLYENVLKPAGKAVSESEVVVYSMEKLNSVVHKSIKNLFSNIVRQMFDDTAKGVHKDYYALSKKIKSLINVESMKVRDAILSRRKNSELFKIDNSLHASAFMKNTMRNDFFKYFLKDKNTVENVDKRLTTLQRVLTDYMGGLDNFGVIKELGSLSNYILSGRGSSSRQQINVDNIINGFHLDKKTREKQRKLYATTEGDFYTMRELAHEYVALKSFSKMKSDDKKMTMEFLSNEKMVKDATVVYNQYIKKRDNIINTSHYRAFNDIPHGHIEYDKTSSDMMISLVPVYDIDSSTTLNKMIDRKIISDKVIVIDGKKYYKVKQKNISSGMEEGFISFSSMSSSGVSLRNTLMSQLDDTNKNINEKQKIVDEKISKIESNPLSNGVLVPSEYGMIPKYDSFGNVSDYIFPITLEDQENHLNYDTDALASIGYSTSKIFRIKESIEKNKEAIERITQDYIKNKDNKKIKYEIISPHVYSKDNQEIWNSIPAEVRNTIIEENKKRKNILDSKKDKKNNSKYEFIAIPKEMIGLVFGIKQSTLANSEIVNSISSSKNTKTAIKLIEREVSLLLGKIKQKNTIFNKDIVSGNFISNMGTANVYGISHIDYALKFKQEWNEIEEYLEVFNEIEKTKIKFDGATNRLDRIRHEKHIKSLNRSLEKFSSLNMLFQDGQFTPLVNDMELTEGGDIMTRNVYKLFKRDTESENFKKEAIRSAKKRYSENESDKKKGMRKLIKEEEEEMAKKGFLPVFMRKAFQNMTGEEGTKVHKLAVDLTIYSDTITRKIILDKLISDYKIKNKTNEVPQQELNGYLSMLDQLLVNYSYATSGEQQYLEKVAGVFYLKYLFASAKGYKQAIEHNPTRVLTQQALQYAITDVADPLDTYKHNPIDSIENRFSIDDPLGMANSLFNPINISGF